MKQFAVVAVLGVLLGVAVAWSPVVALGVAVGVPLLVAAVRRPYLAGLGLILWAGVRFAVLEYVQLGGAAANALELPILIIVVAAALARGRRDHWLYSTPLPFVLLGLFVLSSLASWAVNRGAVLDLVSGLRGMLILPILVSATAVLADDSQHERALAWRSLKILALIQIPIAFVQYFFGGGSTVDPDLVTGTLGTGGANVLGVLMLAVMIYALAEFGKNRSAVSLLVAVLSVFVILMSSARLIVLLVPVAMVLVAVTQGGPRGMSRRVAIGVAVLLVTVPLTILAYQSYRADLGGRIDPLALIEEQTVIEPGRVPRLAYISYGWAYVNAHSAFPALGMGPGSTASGAAAMLRTPQSVDFATGLRLAAAGKMARLEGTVFIPYPTQLTAVLVEYGIPGVVIYMAFVVSMGLAILRRCVRDDSPGVDWRVFIVWFGFMTLGSVYANPWEGFSLLGLGFYTMMLFIRPEQRETV